MRKNSINVPFKSVKNLRCELSQLFRAGSDHAQSGLLHHLTPTVLVGDPGGHAHAARLGAGAPLGGLLDAVQAGVPTVKSDRFLLTVG